MPKTTMPKKKQGKKKKTNPATVFHAKHKDGVHHLIGLGNIRVLLMPEEDGGWFAQGLEIDYAAQGDTQEEAKKEFEEGLEATVNEHLKVHGSIHKLLSPARNEIWNMATNPEVKITRHSQVSVHHVIRVIREKSNYAGIDYLVAAAHAAGACR